MKTATRKRTPCVYEPEGFSAEAYGIPKHLENGVRWLVSTCYFYRVAVWREEEEGWAYLSADLLEKVIGSHLKPVREAAVNAGLVECDDQYIVGEKPFGYRLGPQLDGVTFRRWKGDGGQVFLNRYKRFKDEWTRTDHLDDLGLWLHKWIERVRVTKDVKETLAGLEGKPLRLAERQIEMLSAGLLKSKFCEYGRFHSNITRLVGALRGHLAIGGERLVEIDIVSSQVLFLADLVYGKNSLSSLSPIPHLQPSPSSLLPYDRGISDSFLLDLYHGRVYEKFQCFHGYPTRAATKDEFFHVVYGGVKITDALGGLWPQTAELLKDLKRKHPWKWVPLEMQRRESDLILRTVVDGIRRETPDVPILTVHDSILTTPANLPMVQRRLEEAFSNFVVRPQFRVKGEVK